MIWKGRCGGIPVYFSVIFSSRRRHTRYWRDWSSAVCPSDLPAPTNSPIQDCADCARNHRWRNRQGLVPHREHRREHEEYRQKEPSTHNATNGSICPCTAKWLPGQGKTYWPRMNTDKTVLGDQSLFIRGRISCGVTPEVGRTEGKK